MNYEVQYSTLVNAKEMHRLSKADLRKIKKSIEDKLTTNPEAFGKPLRFSLTGLRCLRVGNYRVIFRIEESIVKILFIGHRSNVYNSIGSL